MSKPIKSKLAIKRDEWFASDEGKKCLGWHSMGNLQDRLNLAFMAGAVAEHEAVKEINEKLLKQAGFDVDGLLSNAG